MTEALDDLLHRGGLEFGKLYAEAEKLDWYI